MSTVIVRYSCPECELFDTPVDVPARRDEMVIVWIEATVRLLVADHKRRNPGCSAPALEDVHIPLLRHGILLPEYRAAIRRVAQRLQESA